MENPISARRAPRVIVDARRPALLPLLLTLAMLLCWSASFAGRGDWWMYRHDLQHTGRSSFTGPKKPLLKWTYDNSGGWLGSSPAIAADGTIYFGSSDGMLLAFKPDGTRSWAFNTGHYISSSPAIGIDGTIYIGSCQNFIAVNADGSQKWVFTTKDNIVSSPAIGTDGTIYIGSNDHTLYAFNPNGTRKWAFTTGGSIASSPAIGADGTVYFGSCDHNLYAFKPDGTKIWSFTTGSEVYSSPVIGADGTIYILSEDKYLYAITPNGAKKWSFSTGYTFCSAPAIGKDGTIYFGTIYSSSTSSVYYLIAVSPDGILKWSYKSSNIFYAPPAIGGDGTIYVGARGDSGNLLAFNPDGSVKWSYPVINVYTTPVIGADGTLYISLMEGKFEAIGDSSSATVTVTPTAGANGTISPSIPQTVAVGTNLTFTAAANVGYTVDSWTLDAATVQTGGTQYTLKNLIANHAVKVSFKSLPTYTITLLAGLNGSVTPNTSQIVTRGTNLTVTATANAGYTVDSWALDTATAQSGGAQYTLSNITANHAVKVTFKALPTYTLTPSVGSNGVITPNTPQTVLCGANFTFIAAANAGYTVDSWYLDNARTQNGGTQYPLANVTANHTLLVIFKALPSYFITPSAGPNGTITPSSAQMVTLGANLTLTATAYAGYTVDSWALDSVLAQTGGAQFALKNITASHLVRVTFKIVRTAIVTPTAGPNGAISPSTPQTVVVGANLSFTAAANAGYTVDCWTCSSTVTQTGGTQYTLSNITAACTVKVTFKKVLFYTVTPTAGTNGTISPPTAQTVTAGSNLSFTATANAGYTTDSWSLDGSVAQTGGTQYTVNNITANHALTVTFKSYATYQPDLALCNNGEAGYTGLDILNLTGVNQTKSQTVAAYTTATYNFQLKNAGHLADSFLLACSSVDMGWHVQVIECATGNDVTAAFVSQTGNRTATLSPGSIAGYILHLMPYSNAKPLTLALTASSVGDTTKKDVVKVVTSKQ